MNKVRRSGNSIETKTVIIVVITSDHCDLHRHTQQDIFRYTINMTRLLI